MYTHIYPTICLKYLLMEYKSNYLFLKLKERLL